MEAFVCKDVELLSFVHHLTAYVILIAYMEQRENWGHVILCYHS